MAVNFLSENAASKLLNMLEAGARGLASHTQKDFAAVIASGEIPVDGHMVHKHRVHTLFDMAYDYKSEPLALAVLSEDTFLKKFDNKIKFLSSTWSTAVLERVLEIKGPLSDAFTREKRLNAWLIDDAPEDVLSWFVDKGMSLDSALDGKFTVIPVHRFAGHLVVDRFELLLRLGADPYISDDKGRSFLHVAVDGNLKTASKLGDTPRRVGELKDFLEACNKHGLDLNRPNNDGMTGLHLAAKFGYSNVVAELIRAGADPQVRDHENQTPLDLATAGKRDATVAVFAAIRARDTILETVQRARAHGKTVG